MKTVFFRPSANGYLNIDGDHWNTVYHALARERLCSGAIRKRLISAKTPDLAGIHYAHMISRQGVIGCD